MRTRLERRVLLSGNRYGIALGILVLMIGVVYLAQVILSQEPESPGSLRNEIERTADYRRATLE